MTTNLKDNAEVMVEAMIRKAASAEKSDDALKFSQAACNAANAMCSLASAKKIEVGN